MLNMLSKTTTGLPLQTVNTNSCGQVEQVSCRVRSTKYQISSITDKGCNKEENEDSILVRSGDTALGTSLLLAVADGVGGLDHGAAASKAAIDGLKFWWDVTLRSMIYSNTDNVRYLINESLSAALHNINAEIYDQGVKTGAKMATTLSIIFILNDWYCVKHAGDSRIYFISKGLRQLTEDHNLLNQYLRSGSLDEMKCGFKALNNVLTKCMGAKPDIELYEQDGEMLGKDGVFLCTDGLYKLLSVLEIGRGIIGWQHSTEDMQQGLSYLVNKARKRGEKDDISAVVMIANRKPTNNWHKLLEYMIGRRSVC